MTANVVALPTAPRPADWIAEYIWLRDNKQAEEARFKTFIQENYSTRMAELERLLLGFLNQTGGQNFGDENHGLAYRKTSVSVTIADMLTFRRHVIGAGEYDLVDWRANKTAIRDLVAEGSKPGGTPFHPGLIGLNYTEFDTIGVRKKGSRE